MDELVRNKYKVMNEIGNGNFGVVHKGFDIQREIFVAIKFEHSKIGILRNEATILNYLSSNKCKYSPIIYWYGIHINSPCIVMPLYKISLSQYIISNHYDVCNINKIFITMLHILETIHNLSVIHRDIKTDNFMLNDNGEPVLIDFGLSSFHHNRNDTRVMTSFTGNAIFASPNVHRLQVANVVDDIISISYIYLFMCNHGKLQWMNIDDTTKLNDTKLEKIFVSKKMENIEKHVFISNIDKRIIVLLRKLYHNDVCYKFIDS